MAPCHVFLWLWQACCRRALLLLCSVFSYAQFSRYRPPWNGITGKGSSMGGGPPHSSPAASLRSLLLDPHLLALRRASSSALQVGFRLCCAHLITTQLGSCFVRFSSRCVLLSRQLQCVRVVPSGDKRAVLLFSCLVAGSMMLEAAMAPCVNSNLHGYQE